ncbi:MAG: sigma-54 dependent transcriptional regulator [Nitrospirota bacterium]
MNSASAKILLIDDEPGMREVLSAVLGRAGHRVMVAESGEQGITLIGAEIFDLVITDLRMPGPYNGMDVLKTAKDISPETLVIILTAFATLDVAIEAMKLGAYDVLTKPFSNDHVELTVRKALDAKRLSAENLLLKRELQDRAGFENIIAISQAMQEVFALVRRVAQTDSTVLICGESGTGKELVARAIHFNSPRRDEAFVTVNCAALPETLLESELFGHMKGAFTGAVANKEGLFEVADGGTLFLDEIGEASLAIQVKLLRVIQEREFRRVGGTRDVSVNVRILAATNKDLDKAVAQGLFREDLFYRLQVIPITLPSLRSRPEDIPALVHHFLKIFSRKREKPLTLEPDAMVELQQQEWKGNVRELENVMLRAVALVSGPTISRADLEPWLRPPSSTRSVVSSEIPAEGLDLEHLINGLERGFLVKALERAKGVKKDAAHLLKLNARSFRYRLDKYGIGRGSGGEERPADDEEGDE